MRPIGDVVQQYLDGNRAIESRVTCRIDLAHPADPKHRSDFVRTKPRSERQRHRRTHGNPTESPGVAKDCSSIRLDITPRSAVHTGQAQTNRRTGMEVRTVK